MKADRLAAAMALVALSGPAQALDDPRLHVTGEFGYSGDNVGAEKHGIGGGAEIGYAPTGFWLLKGRLGLAEHQGARATFAQLGVDYRLDVWTYLPWIGLAPTLYDSGALGLDVSLGVDWLLHERWSLGVGAHLHQAFDEAAYPRYLQIGARLGWRWVLFDPFAP